MITKKIFLLLPATVLSARTVGISDRYQVATVAEFCYTVPNNQEGRMDSKMVVHTPGQSLMLIDRDAWHQLFNQADGDLNSVLPSVCRGESSFLFQPLTPTTDHGGLVTYNTHVTLPARYDQHTVYAVVASCTGATNVEYSISATNPGSFLRRHFSCQDIGLLPTYLVIFSLWVGLWVTKAAPLIRDQKPVNPLQSLGFMIAGLYAAASLAHLTHLFGYAMNGMGLNAVKYLGALFECLGTLLLCIMLALAIEGVGIDLESLPETQRGWIMLMGGIIAAAEFFFLFWIELRYEYVYVARLKLGEKLGGFGLSPYCPLFGTAVGLILILVRTFLGFMTLLRARYLQRQHSAKSIYLWPHQSAARIRAILLSLPFYFVPLSIVILPPVIRHFEVWGMFVSFFVPVAGLLSIQWFQPAPISLKATHRVEAARTKPGRM